MQILDRLITVYDRLAGRRDIIIGIALTIVIIIFAFGTYFYVYSPLTQSSKKANQQTINKSDGSQSAKPYGMALGDTLPSLSNQQLNAELAGISKIGVSWIRIDVSWADIQPDGPSQYNWAPLDGIVASANAHHLKILGTIAYTPPWAANKLCNDSSQKCAPDNDAQFASFAAAVAKRYSPYGLHTWEIWNEENNQGFWQPTPNPLDYTHLLAASYKAIKKVDPNSTIVSGGLGPLDSLPDSISQLNYLTAMYADGAKAYFNALGYHPYSFPALPSEVESWSGWSTMNDLSTNVRTIMGAFGDGNKPVWITEYGAPTGGSGVEATPQNYSTVKGSDHVNEALQADMLIDATNQYKSDSWIGNFFWYSYQDLGTSTSTGENFFGLLRNDGSPKPAYYVYKQTINSSN